MALSKLDSVELAEYIHAKVGNVSHFKLQKLLYYVEAYHLAYFESSLTDSDFEAWLHGPVSRKVWDYYKSKSSVIYEVMVMNNETKKAIIADIESKLDPEQKVYIEDILSEFSPRSAYELECLSHEEYPWQYARTGYIPSDRCEEKISKDLMLEFYKGKLYE